MKIKINEKESYEILIEDEELDCDEFLGLLNRLKEIEKIISKIYPQSISNDYSNKNLSNKKGRGPSLKSSKNKDECIKAMKIMYFGSKKDKDMYCRENNCLWESLTKSANYGKDKFNIKPEEIGLIRFPHKGEGMKIDTLILNPKSEYGVNLNNENSDLNESENEE